MRCTTTLLCAFMLSAALSHLACGMIGPAGLDATSASGSPGGSSEPTFDGLPCEVADLLAAHCVACHRDPPAKDVPMPLVNYAHLVSPSVSDPSRTVAEVSLARMKDAAAPMPPGGLLPASELAPFETWVTEGMPQGDCGSAGNQAPPPLVCTSDTFWTWEADPPNEDLRPEMNPGLACNKCHAEEALEGGEDAPPIFLVAGTVYPTVREPDLCYGAEAATIEVTDAIGRTIVMTSNGTGNFFAEEGTLTMPITATVTFNGHTLVMKDPVDTGDCNSCHTQDGDSGAPGRILLP
jgi:hypothetical protein